MDLAAPWAERARAAWPVRLTGVLMLVVASGVSGAALPLFSGELTRSRGALATVWLLASVAGVTAGQTGILRRIDPRHRLGRSLKNAIAIVLIFVPHAAAAAIVSLIALALSPPESLRAGLAGSVVTLLAAVAASRWSLSLSRALGVVRSAPEHLRETVTRMSEAMHIPVRSIEVLRMSMANAMAFPTLGRVLFTERALDVLDKEDIAGVCAHELAHLSEPRTVLIGRVATSMAPAVGIAAVPLAIVTLDQATWLFPAAGLLVAGLGQRLLQRMETRADAAAREHEPSPGAYARALTRLYEANLTPVVMTTTTHPSLFDRLVSLGAQPDFARPKPPSTWRAGLGAAAGMVAMVLVAILPPLLLVALDDGASTLPIVLTGGGRPHLIQRGFEELHDHPTGAEAMFRACLFEREDDGTCAVGLAVSLSRQPGRCAEALRIGSLAAEAAAQGEGRARERDVDFVEDWMQDVRGRCEE